jgi:hypothetical protein
LEEVINFVEILARKFLFERFDCQIRLMGQNGIAIVVCFVLLGISFEVGLVLFLGFFNVLHLVLAVVSHPSPEHPCLLLHYCVDHSGVEVLSFLHFIPCLSAAFLLLSLRNLAFLSFLRHQILIFIIELNMLLFLNDLVSW